MAFDIINSGKKALSAVAPIGGRVLAGEHKISVNKEPQHAYRWEFLVSGFLSMNEEIQFYAKRASVPAITHETIKKRYAGKEYSYSGRENSAKVLTVQFWDNQDMQIYRFFVKWMQTMNNQSVNSKVNPINYQRKVALRLKDTTDGVITEEFSFLSCYPHEVGEIELDYSSSAEASFDVSFSYDTMQVGYGVVDAYGDVSDIISGARSLAAPAGDLINSAASGVRNLF